MDLPGRIVSRQGEFLLFALTPPRLSTSSEQAQEIADVPLQRLDPLGVDGLILYDIDDESDRNPEERPFPFLPTMDPADYLERHLTAWRAPVVVYRATAKYTKQGLRDWMTSQDTASGWLFSLAPPRARSLWRPRCTAPSCSARRSTPACSLAASRYPSGTHAKATSPFAWSPSKTPVALTSSPRSSTTRAPPRIWCPTISTSAATAVSSRSRSCSPCRYAAR